MVARVCGFVRFHAVISSSEVLPSLLGIRCSFGFGIYVASVTKMALVAPFYTGAKARVEDLPTSPSFARPVWRWLGFAAPALCR